MIVCETAEHLKRFTVNLDQYSRVKAFVIWGETTLPEGLDGARFFLWADFLKLGEPAVNTEVIMAKMQKQKPGECCCLIYTSGTTGNPKGCMLSHDNLTWNTVTVL